MHFSIHPIEPAGAILSTATDMARWIKFNLQSGKTETGTELIDKKLMEEIHWAVTGFDSQEYMRDRFLTMPQYPVDEIQIGYGYAWIVSAYRGKLLFQIKRIGDTSMVDNFFKIFCLHCQTESILK